MTDENTPSSAVDLSGRIALVTGASRGIGAAVAKALGAAGAHVILMARTIGGLEEIDDEIRAAGGSATLLPQDMSDLDKLDNLGPVIAERFGKLDILVGNAGYLGDLTPLAHMDANDWQKTITLNLDANFRLIRTLDPLLRASDAGRALFVTSGAADKAYAYWGAYSTTKAALNAMVKTYAHEVEKTNLRVNLLSPGKVDTAMLKSAFPGGVHEDPPPYPPEAIAPVFLKFLTQDTTANGKIINARDYL